MARSFCFASATTNDATLFLWGLPQKHNLSRLEPNWRQTRLIFEKISGPDPEVFTPTNVTHFSYSKGLLLFVGNFNLTTSLSFICCKAFDR